MVRLLILMQGPPGSGKSTKAQELLGNFHDMGMLASKHSADDFFIRDGVYVFKGSELPLAHKACQSSCETAMRNSHSVVIIDNTNICASHVAAYKQLALEYEYEVRVYRCEGDYGNIHGVPAEKVQLMRDSMENLLT